MQRDDQHDQAHRRLAVCLALFAVAIGTAQARIEVRKDGTSTSLTAGGAAVATIVPFAEKDFTADDAVREVRPGLLRVDPDLPLRRAGPCPARRA